MKREIIDVKYDNKLNIPLTNFSASEMNLLMTICSFVRDKETEEIALTYDQFRKKAKLGDVSNKRVYDMLDSMSDKLITVMTKLERVNASGKRSSKKIILFPTFEQSEENKLLRVAVNPEYTDLLNRLEGNWTGFELLTFTNLNSKYSKSLYRYLKQWKTVGRYTVSLEEFKMNLDIPEKYSPGKIDQKILEPCLKELKEEFEGLRVEKEYKPDGGRGRPPLVGYTFYFKPQKKKEVSKEEAEKRAIEKSGGKSTGLICPECGRPLMHKKINGNWCWCHYDYITGPCSKIYNEVSEIHEGNRLKKEREEREEKTPEQEENLEKIQAMSAMIGKSIPE